jgi:hypothetical protein
MKKEEFQQLVNTARETDLLAYFQSSGYSVEKKGSQYYVKEFPGLCIKPDVNAWYNHYTGVGRTNNSIDCLTLVLEKSFNQAVYELTGHDVTVNRASDYPKKQAPEFTSPPKSSVEQKTKKELHMPEQAPDMRQLFAYLCQTRKIPAAIVEEMVHAKVLYQSQNIVNTTVNGQARIFKNANAVFIHKDKNGEIVGGEIQGLNSFKRYKGIVSGTGDTAFMYMPNPTKDGKPKRAFIFESAIDLMSFYTFCENKKKLEGAVLVSMAGLKPSIPKQLESEGVKIISCVDNDDAGRRFESENNFERSDWVKSKLDDRGFKDWNELLVFANQNPNANLNENTNGNEQKMQMTISRRNKK